MKPGFWKSAAIYFFGLPLVMGLGLKLSGYKPPAEPSVAVAEQPTPAQRWRVVLQSWENRAPIDETFSSEADCRYYMVNGVLPLIQDRHDTFAKCEVF